MTVKLQPDHGHSLKKVYENISWKEGDNPAVIERKKGTLRQLSESIAENSGYSCNLERSYFGRRVLHRVLMAKESSYDISEEIGKCRTPYGLALLKRAAFLSTDSDKVSFAVGGLRAQGGHKVIPILLRIIKESTHADSWARREALLGLVDASKSDHAFTRMMAYAAIATLNTVLREGSDTELCNKIIYALRQCGYAGCAIEPFVGGVLAFATNLKISIAPYYRREAFDTAVDLSHGKIDRTSPHYTMYQMGCMLIYGPEMLKFFMRHFISLVGGRSPTYATTPTQDPPPKSAPLVEEWDPAYPFIQQYAD